MLCPYRILDFASYLILISEGRELESQVTLRVAISPIITKLHETIRGEGAILLLVSMDLGSVWDRFGYRLE